MEPPTGRPRIIRALAATLLAGLPLAAAARADAQSAVVYQDEARFFFSIPRAETGWVCAAPFAKLQYAWVVETLSPAPVLRFGYTAWGRDPRGVASPPDTLTFTSLIAECGQVGFWEPEGRSWLAVPGLTVEARPLPSSIGDQWLLLRITDPRALDLLFRHRLDSLGNPVRVRFLAEGLHVERRAFEVPVRFLDGPAPPLLSDPVQILPTR